MKILLAVDESRFSQAAIQTVLKRADPQKDEVRVVHVVDILTNRTPDMNAYYPGVEHARDAQRKIAEKVGTSRRPNAKEVQCLHLRFA